MWNVYSGLQGLQRIYTQLRPAQEENNSVELVQRSPRPRGGRWCDTGRSGDLLVRHDGYGKLVISLSLCQATFLLPMCPKWDTELLVS